MRYLILLCLLLACADVPPEPIAVQYAPDTCRGQGKHKCPDPPVPPPSPDSMRIWPDTVRVVGDSSAMAWAVFWFGVRPTVCTTLTTGARGYAEVAMDAEAGTLQATGLFLAAPECSVDWHTPDPDVIAVEQEGDAVRVRAVFDAALAWLQRVL